MPDPATRRAQMRQHLQSKHRSRTTPDLSTLSPDSPALLALVEADSTALLDLINVCTSMSFTHLHNVCWVDVLRALEIGVERMQGFKARSAHESRSYIPGREGTSSQEKIQATQEALGMLKRVRVLIRRLPEGAKCADVGRLGFRIMAESKAAGAGRLGSQVGEILGGQSFLNALTDLAKLGIEVDPVIKKRAEFAMDRRQKEVVYHTISTLFEEYKVDMAQEERTARQQSGDNAKKALLNIEKRKKERKIVVARLEKWIHAVEEGFTLENFDLRLDD